MSTYKVTFTVNIEEQDDPAARKHAKGIIEALGEVVSGAGVKLQQVYQDQPPRGVQMGRKKSYQRTRISGVRIFRGAPFKTSAYGTFRRKHFLFFVPALTLPARGIATPVPSTLSSCIQRQSTRRSSPPK